MNRLKVTLVPLLMQIIQRLIIHESDKYCKHMRSAIFTYKTVNNVSI